jgi:hypothetical protein
VPEKKKLDVDTCAEVALASPYKADLLEDDG